MPDTPDGNAQASRYVERCDGAYRIAGTRVSFDSIVYCFVGGQSPETIAQSFPVLILEQVYGSIAYYLGRREEIDRYLEAQEQDYEAKRAAARAAGMSRALLKIVVAAAA